MLPKAGCNTNPLLSSPPIKECENRYRSRRRYATAATEQVRAEPLGLQNHPGRCCLNTVRPGSERKDGAPSTGDPAVSPDGPCVNEAPRGRRPAHLGSSVGFPDV